MRFDGDGSAASWTRCGLTIVLCMVCGCAAPGPGAKLTRSECALDAGTDASDAGFDGRVDASAEAGGPDAGVPDAGARDAGFVRVRRAGRFFTHPDRPIRSALANEPVADVRRGHGGRSLGFKITLADGTRAYFKPAQAFTGMSWRAELAAFHLDRELGLGRVAPSIGRRIRWSALEAAAEDDRRISELEVVEGHLEGALIWWVPERLRAVSLPDGWERWLRIDDEFPVVSPFRRPLAYRERVAALTSDPEPRVVPPAPEPDREDRPAELSDLMVFDYLIHNGDRWGTHNTNIRTLETGGPLMFLDNAAGFTMRRARTALMDTRLAQVQRFRRSTIAAVRQLSIRRLRRRLDNDPLGPLLDARQLENFEERRAHLLNHIDAMVERHGEERVYLR